MNIPSKAIGAAVLVALTMTAAVGLLAHPMTYMGTVVSVEAKTLHVKVIDDTSKNVSTMTFEVTATTKVFRGAKTVKYADAHIQKDERVAVTIDHDEPGTQAVEIRLAAAR
jgi:hypothetical protein